MELSEKKRKALEDLKSQNWYKFYIRNFGAGENSYKNIPPSQFFSQEVVRFWITCAMEWIATKEGNPYWNMIHREWWLKYEDYGE